MPDSNELWTKLINQTFSQTEIHSADIVGTSKLDVRAQFFKLSKARERRIKRTSAKVKAEYDKIEKKKNKIVSLELHTDPESALKRRRRGQSSASPSPSALRKMSIVKRARYETSSNHLSKISSSSSESRSQVYPISHQEAERLRKERLLQRMKVAKMSSKPAVSDLNYLIGTNGKVSSSATDKNQFR